MDEGHPVHAVVNPKPKPYVTNQQILMSPLRPSKRVRQPRRPQPQKLSTGYFDRHFERLRPRRSLAGTQKLKLDFGHFFESKLFG